jgi:hypothetical protein
MDKDYEDFITKDLLSIKSVPNYIYGKQLLIELYETYYGIHNHRQETNPLASVTYNPSEEYLKDGLYENYVSIYIHKELYKKLGMSFEAFIALPRYKINSILSVVDEYDTKRLRSNQDMLDGLEQKNKQ